MSAVRTPVIREVVMNNSVILKSIKYESIKAIFTSIADADRISRAEISAKTDLSLVTVGKIADALLELGIVSQVKEIRPQAGRRAGLLSVNQDKFAVILNITSYEFRCAILNLQLDLIERYAFSYRSNCTFAENLIAFLSEASQYVNRKYSMSECFGVGVAVPGPYHTAEDTVLSSRVPELGSIRLKEAVSRYFKDIPLLIDSHINAAARSNITHVEDSERKNIVYWYVGTRYVCGVYLVNGLPILGKNGHACDFGSTMQLTDLTLEDKIGLCRNEEECAEPLALALYNVSKILSPHTMILDFELPYSCDRLIPMMEDILKIKYRMKPEEIPELRRAWCKFYNSHRGLTMGLRELWLDRIVFGTRGED